MFLHADVKEIGTDIATLVCEDNDVELKKDAVVVCAGGTLPASMLKEIGVMVETYFGTPVSR